MNNIVLSPKYKYFLKHKAEAEALEGTTAAGKTTVGVVKFMLKVAQSKQKLHFISAKSVGDAEKNIIQSDLGITDIFEEYIVYRGNGDANYKIPHIKYDTPSGEKIIFILGYSSRDKWEKALGSQFGCGFIDEINTADIDFVQEATMRCDYNYGLSEEKKEKIKNTVAVGTKLYKNKIQGLRGRAEGLVFSMFDRKLNVITEDMARTKTFIRYSCGVDTSYSDKTEDTISFIFQGITTDGELIVLEEKTYNNKDFNNSKIAPSDVAVKLHNFLDYCKDKWGFCRKVYVDNADQATMMELRKYKQQKGLIYEFYNADKRIRIIDRINISSGWMKNLKYLVLSHCEEHIRELNIYSWKEDKDEPEDRNDHTINASQYGYIPHINIIGQQNKQDNQYSTLVAGFGKG